MSELLKRLPTDKMLHFAGLYIFTDIALTFAPAWLVLVTGIAISLLKEWHDGDGNTLREHLLDLIADGAGMITAFAANWPVLAKLF